MKVGIYPGTFDPIHEGHIAFCLEAIKTSRLDQLVLLPERRPREKQNVTAYAHRVAMARLAAQDHLGLEVADLTPKQFTVAETLPILQELYGRDLVLLLGSDVVRTLSYRWPDLDELLDQTDLVIALRGHDTQPQIDDIIRALNRPVHYICIPSPRQHLASTAVRLRGRNEHVSPSVENYITKNALYPKAK